MGKLKIFLTRINTKLESINRITFVVICVLALSIVKIAFGYVYEFVEERDLVWSQFPGEQDKRILFFISVFCAPLFETWIAQYLPYTLLNKVKYFRERSFLILLISALFFGLNHFYSLFYMIYGFLGGVVLMYGYMVRIKSDNKTFYLIASCHALVNLGVYIKNLVI